ncbi:polysaccharide deacetylase family protein [Chromatocurvus halotolerans]|nr:polysaccharide deacetylase family protein [Chromatocurvus halotolerans]
MALLRRYFNPISLREGVERLKDGTVAPRSICVTFDDGYADNMTVAAPVLARHGIPATVFVATGFLDGGLMWNDRVIETIRQTKSDAVDGSLFAGETISLDTIEARKQAIGRILAHVKHKPLNERGCLMHELERLLGVRPADTPMLDTCQLRALSRSGFDIGAHTVNHPILSCEDDNSVKKEIVDSKACLEDLLQRPVNLFAYPNGRRGLDYDNRHRKIVQDVGFDAAVSTDNGFNSPDTDKLQLHRFTPWDTSRVKFGLRLMFNEWAVKRE